MSKCSASTRFVFIYCLFHVCGSVCLELRAMFPLFYSLSVAETDRKRDIKHSASFSHLIGGGGTTPPESSNRNSRMRRAAADKIIKSVEHVLEAPPGLVAAAAASTHCSE